MSNQLNINIDQGSTLNFQFNLQDPAGDPYNLTGYEARLQVRRSFGATAVEINCTLQNGKLVLTNAAEGALTLVLAPSDTSSIRFNNKEDDTLDCVYDLEVQSPSGRVYKPAKGSFTISREVTR